jgi:formylglycine-generating enzyme
MKKQVITIILILCGFSASFAQSYPKMITVEGGTFTMGDTESAGQIDEQPTHEVTLETFKIAKTETTVAQWKVFCNAIGLSMPETPSWGWIDSHPIVNITNDEAKAYCSWLSEKFGGNWRLPTEAEWEYAARGGNKSNNYTYSGSNDLNETCYYEANSGSKTHSVATKKPNELGLYDMSGNVWEWCKDLYGDYGATAQTNPQGAASGSSRVLRGGGWFSSAVYCRLSSRFYSAPYDSNVSGGFRVVLSL